MNWQEIEGSWEQVKNGMRLQWSKLTDDEIEAVRGREDELVRVLREKYHLAQDAAEKEVENWRERL